MGIVQTRVALREALTSVRARGETVALVPTLGALHEGHLSLIDRASELASYVVVSIFVNPLQFGPGEDLASYPRTLERDTELAAARGARLVFAPGADEMYRAGEPQTRVVPGPMADRLCGAYRPGHFEGVLTVVAKLFNLTAPELAVFGRKDYQQAVLIRRMAEDLDMGVRIELGEIVREPDGLAMSSRNAYLTPAERERASGLYRGLTAARSAFRAGTVRVADLTAVVRDHLERAGVQAQYISVVDPAALEALERAEPGAIMAVAAHVGETRLIDNMELTMGDEG